MELQNKVVVITHATNVLGTALAKALAEQGAFLLLSGNDEPALQQLASELDPNRRTLIHADLSSDAGRVKIVDACREQDTSIDMLINNPSGNAQGSFRATAQSDISQFIDSNLTAPIVLTRALLPQLAERKAAMIVNIGTLSASIGLPGFTVDSTARFGLRGFSEALARELDNTSTKVIYVAHRGLAYPQQKTPAPDLHGALKRPLDKPGVVAKTIIKAIVAESPFTQLGRAERWWIKLNAVSPKRVDRALRKRLPIFAHFAKRKTFRQR